MIDIFSNIKYNTKFRKYYRSLKESKNARSILTEMKQDESLQKSMQKLKKHKTLHSINVDDATMKICSIMGI